MDGDDAQEWSLYFTPRRQLLGLGLVCLGLGKQSGTLLTIRERSLTHFGIMFIENGSGWFSSGSGRWEVSSGSVLWMFPGVPHSYGPGPDGWSVRWILFEGSAAEIYEESLNLNRDRPLTRPDEPCLINRHFVLLAEAGAASTAASEIAMSCQLHQLLYDLTLDLRDRETTAQRLLRALRRDAALPRSVAEHASSLSITVPFLREVVRAATGKSPKEYLVDSRVGSAKDLLVNSDLPVVQIAARVGYDDPNYFTRTFTRNVGIPPTEFRSRYRLEKPFS